MEVLTYIISVEQSKQSGNMTYLYASRNALIVMEMRGKKHVVLMNFVVCLGNYRNKKEANYTKEVNGSS